MIFRTSKDITAKDQKLKQSRKIKKTKKDRLPEAKNILCRRNTLDCLISVLN
jgi:hypothetical protein